jgi:endonuclease/exonuclease/phosphatase family metal-dependent hydrolase
MRIVSLNAWGGRLGNVLLDWIAAAAPDVLCLQEVVHTPGTDSEVLTYRDGEHVLEQRANLYREVCRALPGHAATFCPAARGDLWQGDAAIASDWGIATFVRGDLPVVGQRQDFVFKTFSPDGFGAHPRSRTAHALRLYDPAALRYLSITQMHGLRDPRGKIDTPERLSQAERLIDLCRSVTRSGDVRVVCGDFNVAPDSATLTRLAATGLTELVTLFRHPGTRTSHYPKPGRHADYMLISDPALVRRFEVVRQPEVSDHAPLLLEI